MRAALASVLAGLISLPLAESKGSILTDLPARVDASRRYLFYLHGAILERQGRNAVQPEYGRYEYDAILEGLAGRGLVVISEVRPSGTGLDYAKKVADQARRLLAGGVSPDHVTIAGFSKGGALTLLSAAELQDPRVAFVVMAGCGANEAVLAAAGRMKGRMLSLYDEADREAGSCQATFARASAELQTREIRFTTGRGHGLFYGARAEWLDLVAQWARGETPAAK